MESDLMTHSGGTRSAPRTEFRQHWPAVLACFATAIFAWGFGFYGQSVYLAELQRAHGWSSSLISSATTAFYLMGALLLTRVHAVLDRVGPRVLLVGGVVLMGGGAVLLSRAEQPWQLYPAAAIMALGWACSSSTAITTVLAIWFDRQRGLAISLALNGASAAGFTVAPALVALSSRFGLAQAVLDVVLVGVAVLIPLILLGIGRGRQPMAAGQAPAAPVADGRAAYADAREALRSRHFWSVAIPFSLVLAAQVGFLVHFVAFMMPRLGSGGTATAVSIAAGAAMLGRIALGLVIDRLHQRRVSAISFASQAVALGLMLALPERPEVLYGGALLFGLSVGNVITLPSLIVHREFAGRSFGLVIGLSTAIGQFTFALAPALLGVLRDLAGGYGPVLVVCMALELAAAATILRGGRG
ncbi:MAG TPA: MFS transporter [Acetobacteraceae bacterium]|nr:MFS transporter [Acetobacteraceae bacterium]